MEVKEHTEYISLTLTKEQLSRFIVYQYQFLKDFKLDDAEIQNQDDEQFIALFFTKQLPPI